MFDDKSEEEKDAMVLKQVNKTFKQLVDEI
jgi:hypothetical protein